MNKDLSYFMRKHEEEIVTAPGPASITDKDGKPITLEIRVLSNATIRELNNKYNIRSIATDKSGQPYISNGEVVFKTERDPAKASRHIMVEALVYPNLRDPKLMEHYNCHDITQMPDHVFPTVEEYNHVSRMVMTALGLREGPSNETSKDGEDIKDAKN